MTSIYNFLRPYLRGWPIIIIAMLLGYLAAKKYLNYVTPMYESTAKLRLADISQGIPNSNLYKDFDVFATTQKINAEIEIIKSYALVSKALEIVDFETEIYRIGSILKTELYNDSPILVHNIQWEEDLKDKDIQLEIQNKFNLKISFPNGDIYSGKIGDTISINQSKLVIDYNKELIEKKNDIQIDGKYLIKILSTKKQVSQINSSLDIIAVEKDVPVIRISYKSSHPKKAAVFPNALAEAYIQDYIANKNAAAKATVEFLDERIAQMAKKLNDAERSILDYREGNKITNIRQETETDLRKISQLKIQKTNLEMSLEAIKQLEDYINNDEKDFLELAPNFEAFTDLLSTEIIKNIKSLQAEKKDLLLEYTDEEEKVKVIDQKIEDLTSYLKESISNTRKNLETKYNKLSDEIEKNQKVFIDVPDKERMMTILNREFQIYQKSYNFLNQKKIEAEIVSAVKIAFHRVITPAKVSQKPVSPNRIIIIIVSTILGMMGALLLIFIVHTLKARVNNAITVESNSMLPLIAKAPMFKKAAVKNDFFVKTLAEWEVKKLFADKHIICITGFKLNHGVHFIAKEIANVLVHQGKKVLLVELNSIQDSTTSSLWKDTEENSNLTKAIVNQNELKNISTRDWQKLLLEKSKAYNQTLLINTEFGSPYTISSMFSSNFNIVCLDTRLTPAKRIEELDLITENYNLPNVNIVLNRVGYHPNVLKDVKDCWRKLKQIFSK